MRRSYPRLVPKPAPLFSYDSIDAFYAARDTRFGWSEVDYGCFWRWGNSWSPRYRVTYVRGSGEVYVMQFGGKRNNGRIEVFGQCLDFGLLEQALAGWAEQGERPRSLLWLVEALRKAGLDRPKRTRKSALAA